MRRWPRASPIVIRTICGAVRAHGLRVAAPLIPHLRDQGSASNEPAALSDVRVDGPLLRASIVQPAAELGRQAAHILLDRIAGRSAAVRRMTLPVSLVVRRSCGAGARTVPHMVACAHT
ncbi:MAG: substrate-binding domain-containing protein [Chloroflexi bacterium]|nr:substrate-binding domain-containing protein [Chloroflexota bacterium]